MALPAVVDLETYRGDTWAQTFRFTDELGAPVDLSGSEVAAWAKIPTGTAHVELVCELGEPGEVIISTPELGWAPGKYTYDVEVTEAGKVKTWVRGTINVVADVTNAPTLAQRINGGAAVVELVEGARARA